MFKNQENLIVKYLTKSATAKDLNELYKWIEIPSNKKVFEDFVQTHYAISYNVNNPNTKEALKRVLDKIHKRESFIYKLLNAAIYRRVAAIFLIGLTFSFYFFNRGVDTVETLSDEVSITPDNKVVPGTDKATLTLGDGAQIALEKGTSFQTHNASSNGEEIIYEEGKQNKTEIEYHYLTIPRGGEYFIKLSDGTKVWLNSESQLKFPVRFIDGETREVELVYGEAYFDVTHSTEHKGAKFKVLNRSQEIEVVGTEFNIKAYKDETNIYTTLVNGKVLVDNGTTKHDLIPSQQSNLDILNNNMSVDVVDVKTEIAWKDGIFSFTDKPLKDIMKSISRWYDVDVIFENQEYEDISFIGVLGKNQDIDNVLLTIKTLSVVKDYEIINNTIILK